MTSAAYAVTSKTSDRRRSRFRGHAIAEFAPAFCILIIGFIIPLLDIGFIPLRYAMACFVLTDVTHNLALSNKVSDAFNLIGTDRSWRTTLSKCGVEIKQTRLAVTVIGRNGERISFTSGNPGSIPAELLPDGKDGQGVYLLKLTVDADISPLLSVHGPGVPGLTAPVGVTMLTEAPWENLSRDPETTRFFLNE